MGTIGFVGVYFWSVRTFASSEEVQQLTVQFEKMSSRFMNRLDISDLERKISSLERDIKGKNAEIALVDLLEPIENGIGTISQITQTLRSEITGIQSQIRRHELRLSQLLRTKDDLK